MKPEAITNWNELTFPVPISVQKVYGGPVSPETLKRFGVEVIGFRPAQTGELYLPFDCHYIETARHNQEAPRLILRRKEKKYRYVTDGVERLPKCGEWYRFHRSWLQASLDHTADGSEPQLCFTREEVPE